MDAVQQKVSDYVRKFGRVGEKDLRKHLYDEGVSPADAERVMVGDLAAINAAPLSRKLEPYLFEIPNRGYPSMTRPWTGYKVMSYDIDILVEERHLPAVTGLLPPTKPSGLLPPSRRNDGIKIDRQRDKNVFDFVSRMYILLRPEAARK